MHQRKQAQPRNNKLLSSAQKAELAGEVKDSDFQFFDDKKLAEEKKELEAKTTDMMAILPPVPDQTALNKT